MMKYCKLLVISTLAIGAAFCAPQQQSSLASTIKSLPPSQSSPTKSTSDVSSALASQNKQSQSSNGLSSAASTSSGSPSLVSTNNLKPADELDTFDGKNPFSDDSLWQIPIHLVRDSSANENSNNRPSSDRAVYSDAMTKSASQQEVAAAHNDNDDDVDDESPILAASLPPQSASSSLPTIISASTDLKTAAGYHYPTHGYHHGSGHHGYGGHHGGHDDHYGGKYFQYASVPYPHAWEFGYRRGNPYHTIERYEHGKGPHFQTKVKWSDKHGGYGVHVWDYNHDDHHSHHYGGSNHYDSHGPSHYGGHGHHYGP